MGFLASCVVKGAAATDLDLVGPDFSDSFLPPQPVSILTPNKPLV